MDFSVEVAHAEDEPEDMKNLNIQADLVARFQLAMNDAQAASKGSFENMLKQLRVLNPGVKFNTSEMRVNYYVVVRKILVSDYLEELAAQPAERPSQLSSIVEEETEEWCLIVFLFFFGLRAIIL